MAEATKKNVILFGETGSGKSSVINMLIGTVAAKVSDEAVGCTFKFELYPTEKYNFYDTVGLSEGSSGTVTAAQAVSNLVKLLKSLEDGVNLLIFVVKQGRITKSLEANYKLFVSSICMQEVPVILLLTHCEHEVTMGEWWNKNKHHFEKYGMTFGDTISGCATKGENLLPVFQDVFKTRCDETKKHLTHAIETHSLEPAWKMSSWDYWFFKTFKKAWRILMTWFQIPMLQNLYDLFVNLGMDKAEALQLSNEVATDL